MPRGLSGSSKVRRAKTSSRNTDGQSAPLRGDGMRSACRTWRVALIGAILLTAADHASARENASTTLADSQVWNEIDITLPVSKRLELTWVSLARLSSEIGSPVTYANGLYANI